VTTAEAGPKRRTGVPGFLTAHGWRVVVGLALVALVLYPVVSDNLYYQNMIILSLLLAIMGSGWNIISGKARSSGSGRTRRHSSR